MMYLQILFGFALLLGGAEVMVRGAAVVAHRLGVSNLVIGMTVVAFGTSAPELIVSLQAAFGGVGGIAVGNIVGSNIANILLILGAAATISPVETGHESIYRDSALLVGGTLVFIAACLFGELGVLQGIVLLVAFVFFLRLTWQREDKDGGGVAESLAEEAEEFEATRMATPIAWLMVGGGLAALLFGSDQLVTGGVELARIHGVSEEVIGLTVIAFGTSLPELAASGVAAWRGHSDMALGNIVGSNLFNILMIGGVVAVAHPIAVPDQILAFDLWVMLVATVVMVPFALTDRVVQRAEGLILLVGYLAYVAAQAQGLPAWMAQRWLA